MWRFVAKPRTFLRWNLWASASGELFVPAYLDNAILRRQIASSGQSGQAAPVARALRALSGSPHMTCCASLPRWRHFRSVTRRAISGRVAVASHIRPQPAILGTLPACSGSDPLLHRPLALVPRPRSPFPLHLR